MQIHGLPIERRTEEVIRKIAENISDVSKVKIETKGYAPLQWERQGLPWNSHPHYSLE